MILKLNWHWNCWDVISYHHIHEEDVDAVHAGVLADDRVPRGLDGEDLLSAEEVARVEEAAHSAQASAEIVSYI